MCAGVALLLSELMPDAPLFLDAIEDFCDSYLQPFRTVPHTANGLAYPYKGKAISEHDVPMLEDACMRHGCSTPCSVRCMHAGWGALRYATNAGALTMMHANDLLASPYLTPGVRAYAAQLFNYVRLMRFS
jgi:hypothetical protein